MNTEIIKFTDLERIAASPTFVYAEVVDSSGNLVISGNSGKVKVKDWMGKKVKPLVNSYPAPGVYFLRLYTDKQKRALPHTYAFKLGGKLAEGPPATTPVPGYGQPNVHIHNPVTSPPYNHPGDNVLSYQEALKKEREIAELKAKLAYLEGGGKLNEREFEDEDEDEEEEEQTLGEKLTTTLKSLAEGILPVIDSFAKAKDRTNHLEWARFVAQNPNFAAYSPYKMPVPNEPEPESTHGGVHPLMELCDQWIEANITEEQDKAKIDDMLTRAGNFDQFCQLMMREMPKEYRAMYEFIKAQENGPTE